MDEEFKFIDPGEFKFKVDDEVIIVNVDDCIFGTNDSMMMLEGTSTTVIQCLYITRADKTYKGYKLQGNLWSWSENNLIAALIPPEEADFESILL